MSEQGTKGAVKCTAPATGFLVHEGWMNRSNSLVGVCVGILYIIDFGFFISLV